ncbi:unnamed protein product [Ixodes persulcatus]
MCNMINRFFFLAVHCVWALFSIVRKVMLPAIMVYPDVILLLLLKRSPHVRMTVPYVRSLLGCQQHRSLFCFSERSLGQSLANDGDSCLLALDVSRRHELAL